MLTYRSKVLLLATLAATGSTTCVATGSSECFVGANTAFEADAAGKRCCEAPDGTWGACSEQVTGSTTSGISTSTSPTTTDWTTTTSSTTTMWTTSTLTASTTDPLSTSTTTSSSSTSLDTDTSSTTASDTICGDSEVEGAEECDDGNIIPDDECNNNCKLTCGDGNKIENIEQCDDGNRKSGDGCDESCKSEWVIFATNETHPGNLGGIGGANATCAKAAKGKFPGTFVAWLFDGSDESVKDKLPSGPIVNAKREIVASTKEELIAGTGLKTGINFDENGMSVMGLAWTGTNTNVSISDFHCGGWKAESGTGYTGTISSKDIYWTTGNDYECDEEFHLYCFRSK